MSSTRFRRLVSFVLASPVTLAVGACSDVTEMPEGAACIDPTAPTRYARLTLAPNVDGIAFATHVPAAPAAGPDAPPTVTLLPVLGTPCSRATDRPACEALAKSMLSDISSPGWQVRMRQCSGFCGNESSSDRAVITSGDDVKLATFADLRAAVSPVDTKDEAIALLFLQNGSVDCSDRNVRPEKDGFVFKHTAGSCDGSEWETFTKIGRDGAMTAAGRNTLEEGDNGCIEGRRPAGLRPTGSAWLGGVGACLAEIAHMEAAAVRAFEDLAERLRSLQAPAELLARTEGARRDEVRHAAVMARLAKRHGAVVRPPVVDDVSVAGTVDDSELGFAIENAVEGCVREAFGAIVAAFQGANASDPTIRASFAMIAEDETRHAELSFAIDAWLMDRLAPAAQREVAIAVHNAWDTLAAELSEPAADVRRVAGYPTLAEQRALLAMLRDVADAA